MSKEYGFIVMLLALMLGLSGCGKKQGEQLQEPMTMEELSNMGGAQSTAEVNVPEAKAPGLAAVKKVPETNIPVSEVAPAQQQLTAVEAAKLEPLPPAGPYRPTGTEIQTALKNAGFYSGPVDGKVGPKSKKAIAEFQKANGLKADGKIGPKTWSLLSKHLDTQQVKPAKKR